MSKPLFATINLSYFWMPKDDIISLMNKISPQAQSFFSGEYDETADIAILKSNAETDLALWLDHHFGNDHLKLQTFTMQIASLVTQKYFQTYQILEDEMELCNELVPKWENVWIPYQKNAIKMESLENEQGKINWNKGGLYKFFNKWKYKKINNQISKLCEKQNNILEKSSELQENVVQLAHNFHGKKYRMEQEIKELATYVKKINGIAHVVNEKTTTYEVSALEDGINEGKSLQNSVCVNILSEITEGIYKKAVKQYNQYLENMQKFVISHPYFPCISQEIINEKPKSDKIVAPVNNYGVINANDTIGDEKPLLLHYPKNSKIIAKVDKALNWLISIFKADNDPSTEFLNETQATNTQIDALAGQLMDYKDDLPCPNGKITQTETEKDL